MASTQYVLPDFHEIFGQLDKEYDNLIKSHQALYDEVRELNNRIESAKQENIKLEQQLNQIANQPHSPTVEKEVDKQADQINAPEYLVTYTGSDDLPKPFEITLLAEIIEISIISATAFSPDSKLIAIGTDHTVRVYDLAADQFVFQQAFEVYENSNQVRSIVWTSDSKHIVCGCEDGKIRKYNIYDGEATILPASKGEVYQLDISPDHQLLAAVTGDGLLTIFHIESCEELTRLPYPNAEKNVYCICLSFSLDGKSIAVGYNNSTVIIWDLIKQSPQIIQECHSKDVYSIKYVPNSNQLVTASLDTTIKLWEIGDSQLTLLTTFDGHTDYVLTLSVDKTGRWLLSGSKDLTAGIFDLQHKTQVFKIQAHQNTIFSVSLNQEATTFCTGSGDMALRIWAMNHMDES